MPEPLEPLPSLRYTVDARMTPYMPPAGILEQLGLTGHTIEKLEDDHTLKVTESLLTLDDTGTGQFTYLPFFATAACLTADQQDNFGGAFFGCDGFHYTAIDEQGCAHDGQVVLAVRPEPEDAYIRLESIVCRRSGFVIEGVQPDTDYAGAAVRAIGDINGDGFDDVLLGAPLGTCANNLDGKTDFYVVFGQGGSGKVALDDIVKAMNMDAPGRRIVAEVSNGCVGEYAGHLGDFNGDGVEDFILGAPGQGGKGRAYIVFGSPTLPQPLALAQLKNLGAGGFVINGEDPDGQFGSTVTGAGDVNGDGLQDALISAKFADHDGKVQPGKAYVVFGSTEASPPGGVGIDTLVQAGKALAYVGEVNNSGFGYSAAGGLEVNGDGLADIAVSAVDLNQKRGRTYVIFGQTEGPTPELSAVAQGDGGFAFDGAEAGSYSGEYVHAFDGTDTSWLLVGTPTYESARGIAHALPLENYVNANLQVPVTLDESLSGSAGFWIHGKDDASGAGRRISGGGDFDGDGLPDLLVAAPGAIANDEANTGQVYALYSKDFTTPIDLSAPPRRIPPERGFALAGEQVGDFAGSSIDGRGDINGDGLADIVVGARNGGISEKMNHEGRAYVVFGGCFTGASTTHLGRPPSCQNPEDCPFEVIMAGNDPDGIVGGSHPNDIRSVGDQDIVYAGAGDDKIEVIQATFQRITGGRGEDTLLVADGVSLDFTMHRLPWIEGIETIELAASAAVTLDHAHVRALAADTRTLRLRGAPGAHVDLELFDVKLPTFTKSPDLVEVDGVQFQQFVLAKGKLPLSVEVQVGVDLCVVVDANDDACP